MLFQTRSVSGKAACLWNISGCRSGYKDRNPDVWITAPFPLDGDSEEMLWIRLLERYGARSAVACGSLDFSGWHIKHQQDGSGGSRLFCRRPMNEPWGDGTATKGIAPSPLTVSVFRPVHDNVFPNTQSCALRGSVRGLNHLFLVIKR